LETVTNEPRAFPASRLVAYSTILIGAGWALIAFSFIAWLVVSEWIAGTGTTALSILMVFMGMIASIPALICLYYGRRLLGHTSMERVRGAVGALAIAMGVMLEFGIDFGVALIMPNKFALTSPTMFAAVIVMLPIYTIVCRQILIHDGFVIRGYGDILTRRVLIVSAWLIYFSLSGSFASGRVAGAPSTPLTMLLGFVLPILIAWGFYRIACRVLGHTTRSRGAPFMIPPQN